MEENDDDHQSRFLEALLVRCWTASLKTEKCISKLLFTESLGFLPYTNHCVYVMVTTSCLGDSLKNTRLRCDKPFL